MINRPINKISCHRLIQCIRFYTLMAVALSINSGCSDSGQPDSLTQASNLLSNPLSKQEYQHWQSYGGDAGNSHYSALEQINRDTVQSLQPAWQYNSADGQAIPAGSELQVNPIIIDGILYGRNPNYNVFAVAADSGEELWTYQPAKAHVGLSYMRGLSYWQDSIDSNGDNKNKTSAKPSRIFVATSHYLTALDAKTGKAISSFGEQGTVDLRAGLRRDIDKIAVYAPSPGVIFENLIIMGSAVNETRGAAPGDIRAYDVISGELQWSFHTIPLPDEYGHNTWPKDYWQQGGGANAWAGLSVDVERGVVYVPTGSATPDFDGSSRHGSNLFANTILALDAKTGKRIWHYQTVHHDLWDRDLSSAPTLASINKNGKTRDVLVQASKQGVIYLLDRKTGEPVFPINEVATPPSDIPGERSHQTQPQVTLPEPFTRQAFTEDLISDINPKAYAHVKAQYDQAAEFAYFRPPGLQASIMFPGFYGGANWGGGAFDPESGIYFINAMEDVSLLKIETLEVDKGSQLGFGEFVYKKHCGGCHGSKLEGFYPYAPSLANISQTGNRQDALAIVNSGKGRMMPFSHLPRHEQSAALDYLFSLSEQLSNISSTKETEEPTANHKKETAYVFGGYTPMMDDRYYPAVKPPWGTLNAIDLASGKRLWQITLGEYAELSKEGIPPTGTRNYGGPVVTKGGLIIIAASSDEKLRIFDKDNGQLLWDYQLPAAGYATPATYKIDGRQYIVITCGGGKLGTKAGDQYIAFALPD